MGCAECYEVYEGHQELVISGCSLSEVFEFVEEALDDIALPTEIPIAGMWPSTVVPGWDDRHGASLQGRVMEMVRVVGPVGNDSAAWDALNQTCAEQDLAAMAGACDQANRVAKAVGCGMELGSKPTLGAAKALGIRPPFSLRAPLAC